MMSCIGASAVLKVAVMIRPLYGLRSVIVGVNFGDVMSETPVKSCCSLPLLSLLAVALW